MNSEFVICATCPADLMVPKLIKGVNREVVLIITLVNTLQYVA
jgi:hypothetical protein